VHRLDAVRHAEIGREHDPGGAVEAAQLAWTIVAVLTLVQRVADFCAAARDLLRET
jgi:hypothetical protein